MLLLLSTLAAQTVLHQARLRNAAALGQRRLEDALASGAHQLVGRIVLRHPCLLELSLEDWSGFGGACADAADQAALRQGGLPTSSTRLLAWRPGAPAPDTARRRVDLELTHSPGPTQPPWRAVFALELQGDPPRVLGLRELGLRGARP